MPASDLDFMNTQDVAYGDITERRQADGTSSNSVALTNHSMELIFRVLRTWPCMLAEEFQSPPLFHFTHLAQSESLPRPLATCISVAKMWNGHYAGAEEIVRSTVLKELDSIVQSVSARACTIAVC